ncbi:AbrB/MazE/SpoVT family DNA-binding domain-containing protein [Brevibacillus fluminis]|jgi:transcriptional pleiotropic regulator of transition state genes|uniref:AbrB/MazE/SpoVT family DNA-binding domain-containing protein n=1 Tax=Brevibacillus fluminis TaxID=511487 RepID=A0A3M8D4U6_9BACL|nr:AbrB/MazE/SpoVT family DNA-binding domain-containing protein [Brevibacillus fluminis]RNB82739.1 AbrB/MazE/SpoVT family DNA-binding domain-containing protein [Brevibacillus fluminis]
MLKSTGIVRKVDELGRVVIPIELRRTLGIAEKDALEIFVDGERIILKKYEPACIFSGNAEDLVYYKGKMISKECVRELAELLNEKAVK